MSKKLDCKAKFQHSQLLFFESYAIRSEELGLLDCHYCSFIVISRMLSHN